MAGTTVKTIGGTVTTSGTYTPTYATQTGTAPTSMTVRSARWMRVGNTVTVSGTFYLTPANTSYVELTFTLPTDGGANNFTGGYDAAGVANRFQMANSASIMAVAGTRKVYFGWSPGDISSRDWNYIFEVRRSR